MIFAKNNLHEWLQHCGISFHPVVKFNPDKEKMTVLDFTKNNEALQKIDIKDTITFCKYINNVLETADAKFGVGGYNELRSMYSASDLFDDNKNEEPRRLHIGFDIWGKAGTEVFAPLEASVHSFAFNDNFGDYGATIILQHQFEQITFYTLYGHVSLADVKGLKKGNKIQAGQAFAHFGVPEENGHWPPHLHFQIIDDIGEYSGDYPGVCRVSEKAAYLTNCPDPELILNWKNY